MVIIVIIIIHSHGLIHRHLSIRSILMKYWCFEIWMNKENKLEIDLISFVMLSLRNCVINYLRCSLKWVVYKKKNSVSLLMNRQLNGENVDYVLKTKDQALKWIRHPVFSIRIRIWRVKIQVQEIIVWNKLSSMIFYVKTVTKTRHIRTMRIRNQPILR
jgi:hypothetical protein